MKLLIAVKSCQHDLERGDHEVIRKTWGKEAVEMGADVRFFIGSNTNAPSCALQSDEVVLNVEDDYHSLPYKTREICRWALEYDHVFLCDTDTCVWPKRLFSCRFENYDYVGQITRPFGQTFSYNAINRSGKDEQHDNCYGWASGGIGYFLSRKAVNKIAQETPTSWAEDLWVGQVMGPLLISGEMRGLDLHGGICSLHFPSPQYGQNYDPKFGWMEKTYKDRA
jgi:hypothetical protein